MCWSLFLTLSKTPSFFKNTYLEEQLRTTALVNQEKKRDLRVQNNALYQRPLKYEEVHPLFHKLHQKTDPCHG